MDEQQWTGQLDLTVFFDGIDQYQEIFSLKKHLK